MVIKFSNKAFCKEALEEVLCSIRCLAVSARTYDLGKDLNSIFCDIEDSCMLCIDAITKTSRPHKPIVEICLHDIVVLSSGLEQLGAAASNAYVFKRLSSTAADLWKASNE